MAHMIQPGPQWGTDPQFRVPMEIAAFSPSTIRNWIDNHGFTIIEHESEVPLPGIYPSLLSGQVTTNASTTLMSPLINTGGTGVLMPSGIVAPNWAEILRQGIDIWMGGGGGGSFQQPEGPLALPPQSPTPGLFPPGGLQGPIGGGGVRTGGRAAFITMPNGMLGCPSGYHPEKQGKPYCVRNRRMNPLNPRALSRATRRVGGFARAVQRARTIKKVCRSL